MFRLAAYAVTITALVAVSGERAFAALALTRSQVMDQLIGQRLNFQARHGNPLIAGTLVYEKDGSAHAQFTYGFSNGSTVNQSDKGRWTIDSNGSVCTEWVLGAGGCFYFISTGKYGNYRNTKGVEYFLSVD